MLVLSRRPNERVTLTLPSGDRITVAVNKINRHEVSLAFDAPKDVRILRDNAIVRQEKAANRVVR